MITAGLGYHFFIEWVIPGQYLPFNYVMQGTIYFKPQNPQTHEKDHQCYFYFFWYLQGSRKVNYSGVPEVNLYRVQAET